MPQPDARIDIFRFGAFELASATGELRKSGLRLKRQDQPTRILILLLENAGEIALSLSIPPPPVYTRLS